MADIPWRPSRKATILLGLLTAWPLLYLALFFASVAFFWLKATGGPGAQAPNLFAYIFPLHCFTMLLTFALIGIFIFHAFKTDLIAPDKRVLWVIVLFLGNMLAFPFYWYFYMWRPLNRTTPPPTAAA